jgi:hypothetical protein
MTKQRAYSSSSPLVVHAKQLVQLDRMMAAGHGDSSEADALRDQMDESWYQMNEDELKVARQLSGDLYTLHDDALVSHPADFSVYSQELASELAASVANGDCLSALRLMQERPSEISKERAALFRAILYRALGLPDIALVFFEQVAPAGEKTTPPHMPLLDFLWQHVNLDTATAAACAGRFATSEWNAT